VPTTKLISDALLPPVLHNLHALRQDQGPTLGHARPSGRRGNDRIRARLKAACLSSSRGSVPSAGKHGAMQYFPKKDSGCGCQGASAADAEETANRNGASNDRKADAAVGLAANIARERGHVSAVDLSAVKSARYDDAQVIEMVLHAALNSLTNCVPWPPRLTLTFPSSPPARRT
jgi:hypothetical protein